VVSFTPRPLYPGETSSGVHWIGGLVGLRVGLDTVQKRNISCPCRESNPGLQSIACRYTDYSGYWKIVSNFFSDYTRHFFSAVLPGIYLGRIVSATNGKELNTTINKMYRML
jgi:hypothetical protein